MIKKILMTTLIVISITIASTLPALATNEVYKIRILDSETQEEIPNANIELLVIRDNIIFEKSTDNEGYINLNKNEYETLQDVGIYILVQKGFYKAESSCNLDNNRIYVTPTTIVSDDNISTYGATDWNTIKSSADKYIYVPYYRIPTYGGLTAKVTFSNKYSGGWTISGGDLFTSSYTSITLDNDSYMKSLSDSKGKYWLDICAETRKYKIVQQNTVGQTRTIYVVDNKVYQLKGNLSSASFSSPTSIKKRIDKGNTDYTAGFGIASTVSFTLSGTYATEYGKIKGSMKISSDKAAIRYYKSTGTYSYEIGEAGISRK